MAKSRLVQATARFGDCLIVVHLQEDLMRSYESCGLSNAAAEARAALMESRSDLAPKVPSFMSRACSPFAPMRGVLQRLLG